MAMAVAKTGQWHDLNVRMRDVTRPLAPVYNICQSGSSVVFNPPWGEPGGFTYNHESGMRTHMGANDGAHVLETGVVTTRGQTVPSFGTQGRRIRRPEQAYRVAQGMMQTRKSTQNPKDQQPFMVLPRLVRGGSEKCRSHTGAS